MLIKNSSLALTHRATGFTLLEVMVALLIIGLALPALMGRMASMAGTVGYNRELTIAHWVAENKVQEIELTERLQNIVPKGRQAGDIEMAGIIWDWSVEAEEQKDDFRGTLKIYVRVGPQGQEPMVELVTLMAE
ncbi:MAG: type II secretion system minor pseudopilin GspI [Marinagarivorans sp.]|nr:type II secretion system minor pseudopilin GspI [Marinagarivorans sp.]